jgi:hypothetical protein
MGDNSHPLHSIIGRGPGLRRDDAVRLGDHRKLHRVSTDLGDDGPKIGLAQLGTDKIEAEFSGRRTRPLDISPHPIPRTHP